VLPSVITEIPAKFSMIPEFSPPKSCLQLSSSCCLMKVLMTYRSLNSKFRSFNENGNEVICGGEGKGNFKQCGIASQTLLQTNMLEASWWI